MLGPRTRVVAVTGASNLLGTRPDVPAIAEAVHAAGALLFVDGVHLTPHAPVDAPGMGADFFACSPYKFFGPHLGVLAADPALLATVEPPKLLPQTDAVPERFELGTLPYELLAGVTAAVDFIADLVPGEGPRRERVRASMAAVEAYEDELFGSLLAQLGEIDGVTLHGRAARRTPTALFSVRGHAPDAVFAALAERGVNAPVGQLLRPGGRAVHRHRRARCRPRRLGAVHERRRRRPAGRGRGRARLTAGGVTRSSVHRRGGQRRVHGRGDAVGRAGGEQVEHPAAQHRQQLGALGAARAGTPPLRRLRRSEHVQPVVDGLAGRSPPTGRPARPANGRRPPPRG